MAKPDRQEESLRNWESEGGAPMPIAPDTFPIEVLDDTEKRVLSFLGASILSLWDTLPDDFRRAALRREAAQAVFDREKLRQRIEQFLAERQAS